METITITFGDQAENHVGMQKIGQLASHGFTCNDLHEIQKKCSDEGYTCEFMHLNDHLPIDIKSDDAGVLIVRNGVSCLLNDSPHDNNELFEEQKKLDVDKKAFMYGRVVNKKARWNLCYAPTSQKSDIHNGKGTIVAYSDVPALNYLRNQLHRYMGEKSENLMAEMNYYYDTSCTGIGFHGDSERRIVIGVRLGASIPLHYQWFHRNDSVGTRAKLTLNGGDIYIMSEKAVGTDWKHSSKYTLRHAAGCEKFLTIKKKKRKCVESTSNQSNKKRKK
jgi:alkylated DNA repair dioxygenase AlkB